MRLFKTLAAGALCMALIAGVAVAQACDKDQKTASATASSACCAKGATAMAASTTAAGTGCAAHAAVMTAEAGGCAAAKAAMAASIQPSDIAMEAVQLPGSVMAVLYTGKTEAAAAYLVAQAKEGCASFGCSITREMAANQHCKVEMAAVSNGVLVLVQSDDSQVLDGYAKKIEVALNTTSDATPQGN